MTMRCLTSIMDKDSSLLSSFLLLEILRKSILMRVFGTCVIHSKPLIRYFKKFDLSITHVEENDYMSGSLRIFVGYGKESN